LQKKYLKNGLVDKLYMTESAAQLFFALCDGIGPLHFGLLLDYFGSAQNAFTASTDDFIKLGIRPAKASHIINRRKEFDLDKELKNLAGNNVWFVPQCDKEYPEKLINFKDKPIVLFGKGDR